MLAVHFGAGNIGRGFIGALLYQSDFHTTFVDVNEKVIDALNDKQQYRVVLADEQKEELVVKNVSGINSMTDPEKVIEAIGKADLITTAVGPNILPIIADLIAKGLQKRIELNKDPVNVIACENMIGGSALLQEKVLEKIPSEQRETFNRLYGFPNAAVDRIVPNQSNEDMLMVSVEPYYEWVVEETAMKGEKPDVKGITYVSDLTPYIERKLFTVNTGHAVAAYIGMYKGLATITEAMEDTSVQDTVKAALKESGEILIHQYGFDQQAHEAYINKIIKRFLNPYISDEVTRVGRGPLRKLGANDRLIRPAKLYMDTLGKAPENLAKTIAAALLYSNEADEEAVKLQQMVKEKGYTGVLETVSGLEKDHPLVAIIMEQIEAMKK
ncbi:mannitol-1-phosphate 5-dehydrogenase [Radiobacillus sp. PE A8.2]|uniref:mannitol-1-phosphate 5-dehydrogenase n=1 Tax=Radiobacillus sp. PE A8.2 TaxID=3380349 RepID=UPI00388FE761